MEPVLPRTPAAPDPDWSDDEDIYEPAKVKRGAADSGPVVVRKGGRWRSPTCLLIGCLGCVVMCCVLPICVMVIGGATMGAVIMNSKATESGSQVVELTPGEPLTLTVDNLVGDVTIQTGTADQVIIDYTKTTHGWSRKDASASMNELVLKVEEPEDNVVNVTVQTGRTEDDFWVIADKVSLTLTVPPDLDLSIETNVGKVRVEGVTVRGMDITTNVGEIVFEGALNGGTNDRYMLTSIVGEIVVRLPQDSYAAIDASSDVSTVTVSEQFSDRAPTSERAPSSSTWTGTIGSGSGRPPKLTLRSSTGRIQVEPQ